MTIDHPAFLQESIVTLNFIKDHLYDKDDNRLYRLYRKDDQSKKAQSRTSATLSDYAWLIYGLLEVYKAGHDKQWLELAVDLQDKQDVLFLDESCRINRMFCFWMNLRVSILNRLPVTVIYCFVQKLSMMERCRLQMQLPCLTFGPSPAYLMVSLTVLPLKDHMPYRLISC